jgi:hypothetical protein
MFDGIFAASRIHSIAICKEWFTSQLLHHIDHSTGIIRAQITYISQLSKIVGLVEKTGREML